MNLKHWWQYLIFISLIGSLIVATLLILTVSIIYPSLPSLEALTDYRPKLPLRIYSVEGDLIGEYGEERRAFVSIDRVPKVMKNAIMAIEDRRFYSHNGIDTTGILRAIRNNVTGRSHEGASTITMQVAKNFFSKPDQRRNIWTKIKEAMLAIKIENSIKKDKILELYINQIFLGQRSYGFSAASQVYFAKDLSELNLAEAALLAGLPKAPSKYNPYLHPEYAITRQQEVLRDMRRYGFIKEADYQRAINTPLKFKSSKKTQTLSTEYVAEIVRNSLYQRFGEAVYHSGFKVYTTIKMQNQLAANQAVSQGIIDYEHRHGYRGPEAQIDLSAQEVSTKSVKELLEVYEIYNQFIPAIVVKAEPNALKVITKKGELIELRDKSIAFVQKHILNKKDPKTAINVGAIIRVTQINGQWEVVQLPEVEASFIAINPLTGAVNALVGGFSYQRNKFNHATQAKRQPGSSFKPFIYSAALEKGYSPASIFQDAPLSFSAAQTGSNSSWEPQNYDEKFSGPTRLRAALIKSKNTVSIRVMSAIGARFAQNYVTKFGFNAKDHPPYLSTALGAGSTTLWQMAAAYSVFANSGYRVSPYLIERVVDNGGNVIESVKPNTHVSQTRVIDQRNAFIMTSMMQDVIRMGTGRPALSLGRDDIAGKTGTTNDQMDVWFAGYNPKEVAIAWMGYDQPKSLGKDETGGRTALPIWINYMKKALANTPVYKYIIPEGVLQLKINPNNGLQVSDNDNGIFEYFYDENLPNQQTETLPSLTNPEDTDGTNENSDVDNGKLLNLEPEHSNHEPSNKLPANPAQKLLNPSGL